MNRVMCQTCKTRVPNYYVSSDGVCFDCHEPSLLSAAAQLGTNGVSGERDDDTYLRDQYRLLGLCR